MLHHLGILELLIPDLVYNVKVDLVGGHQRAWHASRRNPNNTANQPGFCHSVNPHILINLSWRQPSALKLPYHATI
jgi:hypothetical protein